MDSINNSLTKLGSKTLLLFSAVFLFGFAGCGDDNDPVTPPSELNIVERAESNDNLSILANSIDDAGLTETLQGEGPFTVFAPSNSAFNNLPDGTIGGLTQDQLAEILTFHVIEGEIPSGNLDESQTVETVLGEEILITVDGGTVTVNGNAVATTADIEASNGVIHIIDEVLLPQAFRDPNIVDTAENNGNFTTLVGALEQTGLKSTIQYLGPFTVFAPTDAAFNNLPSGLLDSLSDEELAEILQYHVLSGTVLSGDLAPEQAVPSLTEEELFVTANGGVNVNGGTSVVTTDVEATNGVIHAIDAVLLPNEYLDIVQIVQKDYNLTSLVTALSDAGLVSTLKGDGPFTVFAPTNEAFEAASSTIESLSDSQVSEVLQYHAAAAELLSDDLSDGQTISTVQGEDITVSIDGEGNVTLNGSVNVIEVDRQGTNGVVHIIDGVLVPPSFN